MFRKSIQLFFSLYLIFSNFLLVNSSSISEIKRKLENQIVSLRNEDNLKEILKNGGIFDCDKKYCSQISLFQNQQKQNQIQKFPEININKLYSSIPSNIDLSKLIIGKIFSKHNFPIDSDNYISGINAITNLVYVKLYYTQDDENNMIGTSLSSIGYNNLLVYLPLYIDDNLKNKILSISGQSPDKDDLEDMKNYDIFNPEAEIYNDICYPITFSQSLEKINGVDSFKNFDITLEQRKKYYFPGNLNLCPKNCGYFAFHKNSMSSICICNDEYFYNIQSEYYIENEEYINFNNFDKKEFYDSDKDIYFSMNTLKCLKLPFTSEGFKNNYGSFCIILIALILSLCFSILFIIGKEYIISILESLCNSIPKFSNNNNIGMNHNEKIETNKLNLNSNENVNSNNEILMQEYNGKKRRNSKRKSKTKIEINKVAPPKRKYSLIGDGITFNEINLQNNNNIEEEVIINNEIKNEEKTKNVNEKTNDKINDKINDKTNDKTNDILLKEQYENKIKKLKEKNERDIKLIEQEKNKEIRKLQNIIENINNNNTTYINNKSSIVINKNIINNNIEINSLLVTVPLCSLFSEQELNSMNLEQSLKYDKRGFFQIYFSFINMKQPLFFLFNYYSKNNSQNFQIKFNSLRIIIFLYEIMIYLFLYSTFFGSKSITKIYFGTFNFGKKCLLGMIIAPFCMIIKSIIQHFIYNSMNEKIINVKLKSYSYYVNEKNKYNSDTNIKLNINENINNLQDTKDYLNNEFIGFVQDLIFYLKKKFLIFSICSLFAVFFEWCLVSSFCSVYKNSQIEFFASILVCYLFANLYAFIYCFIPTIFRYYALKMNSALVFKIAEITKII